MTGGGAAGRGAHGIGWAASLLAVLLAGGCAPLPANRGVDEVALAPDGETEFMLRPLVRLRSVPVEAPASGVALVTVERTDDEPDPDDDPGAGEELGRGGASWYGIRFHNRRTASGERFDMGALTAAHRTLPFGTMVCVRSLVNGEQVVVRVTDRGPGSPQRIIDLSRAAAEALDMLGTGIKQVVLSKPSSVTGRCVR
ncbi:septal ring lytic transglycosylase RlpA family protein [Xylophilus ampelinus]|uniref:Endolytic peptidoglycan transglycosylase RlpA n=1 Tax=Xylophilus ampelinus TaxID=54067 RepID=A0A318SGI1_9BURK|nr:septal ring lytic transglycosylase RlpA family protein [Xylophilus ampelinus]MCS4510478.1 septal ring lytic transglycosylase RlpA family protein [Xylophilus ampelinus]PYE77933.1 rare lipoprotein A [Xylophilus ampelinus]